MRYFFQKIIDTTPVCSTLFTERVHINCSVKSTPIDLGRTLEFLVADFLCVDISYCEYDKSSQFF